MTDVGKLLEEKSDHRARVYFEAIHRMYVAAVRGNRVQFADARDQLDKTTRETMGMAELLGAGEVLRRSAQVMNSSEGEQFRLAPTRHSMVRFASNPTQTIVPRVTLAEAVDDFVERTPVTIRNAAERTAQRIAQLYSSDRVAAFARAATQTVTEEAQSFILRALKEGFDEGEAGRRLAMSVNEVRGRTAAWSEAYARMVFRTNVNTAVTAGRFRQTQDPDIRQVIPAFRFDAVGDRDTRDNHEAADGLIFTVDNLVWNRIAPPLGYNCRCRVSLMTQPQLRRMGRIDNNGRVIEDRLPPGAFPDEGFRHGGRPDLFVVAA